MTGTTERHEQESTAGAAAQRWDWIVAVRESELDPTARLVAFALSFHMDADGTKAYPGPTLLSRESGLSLRSVKAKLGELERVGWLKCVERGRSTPGGRLANRYRATIPTRAGDAPVQDVPRAGGSTTRAARSTTGAGDAPQTFSTPDDSAEPRPFEVSELYATAAGLVRVAPEETEPLVSDLLTRHGADVVRQAVIAVVEAKPGRFRYTSELGRALGSSIAELERDRSARRYVVDRSCETCAGTRWGITPDDAPRDAPPPPCPDCCPAVAS
jgi:hypothetical protein